MIFLLSLFYSLFSLSFSLQSFSSDFISSNSSHKTRRQLGGVFPFSSSHTTVVMTPPEDLLAGKWLDQWPIGNGKIGTLVGGSIAGDILPVSLEGFFVRGKLPNNKPEEPKYLQFQRSREALIAGDIQDSRQKLSSLVSRNPLGMFQYICDVVLLFSPSKIRINQTPYQQNSRDTSNFSRKKVWNDMNSVLSTTSFGKLSPQSKSSLDMMSGVVRTTFQSQSSLPLNSLHHIRTWYATAVDDVIVGRLKCRSKGNIPQSENCLHFGLRLSRHVNKNGELMGESGWNILPWSTVLASSSNDKTSFVQFGAEKIGIGNVFGLELSLLSTTDAYHSGAFFCGAIICLSTNKMSNPEFLYSNDPLSRKYFVCNEASEAHIILSTHSDNYTEATKNKKTPSAQTNCWGSIKNALQLGPETLRKRHVQSFSQMMSASEIHFGEKDVGFSLNASLEETSEIASQLQLLSQSTLKTSSLTTESLKKLYSSVLTSSYWYSKYLMLSSSSRSVNNLQGLWADGPFNPWNSDYHLNINVQMTYWPVHQFGIHSAVMPPLIEFIRKMSQSGKQTAKELYNCKGWVAHGFTDNLLDVGVRGGLEWAMCVTCGSWLALHLWDHLTYTHYPFDFIFDVFFPIYRSMITFYLSYLFEGPDGLVHSGPTTSPENSYSGKDDFTPDKKITNVIAFSPAIDLSILRQVANSFSTVISWTRYQLKLDKNLSQEKMFSAQLDQDYQLSNQFTKLIRRMKNSAVPLIHPSTNQILEYPINNLPLSPSKTKAIQLSETLDRGHRHFSSLHWLYPGTFIPFDLKGRVNYHEGDEYEMIQATKTTLGAKIAAGGGHTGWSAAWETCLWARLRKGTNSLTSLKKLLSKYMSRNLFGLHPKLQPSQSNCETCYAPSNQAPRGDTASRGMSTGDASVYQMEANSGLAAGMLEMIFQSHVPSVLLFLPAIPADLSSGEVKGLLSRGGFQVNFKWKDRLVQSILIQFSSWHPWFIPQSQETEGYYTIRTDQSSLDSYNPFASLTLILPNTVKLVSHFGNEKKECASLSPLSLGMTPPHISLSTDVQMKLEITTFPCEVLLCNVDDSEKTCRRLSQF